VSKTEQGSKRAQRLRLAAAAILSGGLLVPLAVFGGTGLAQSSSAAQYQYKITICHHTHSKKHPMHTIRVSVRAWQAHQKHGDTLGACPAPIKPSKAHNKSNGQNSSQGQNSSPGQSGSHGNGKGHGK
jgi:hypothetical protein